MTLEEIKKAVENDEKVYWKNHSYRVIKDHIGQFFIKCPATSYLMGLTHADKVTLNGKPEDFFVDGRYPVQTAIDFLRDFGGLTEKGLSMNRSDGSRLLDELAVALGTTREDLSERLAAYAIRNQERLSKEAADRLIKAIRPGRDPELENV